MDMAAIRVRFVRAKSVTLMEQGSVVTAVTVLIILDCILGTRCIAFYIDPNWPHVQHRTSADGYIPCRRYSFSAYICLEGITEILPMQSQIVMWT
jgi:hypothetical protein